MKSQWSLVETRLFALKTSRVFNLTFCELRTKVVPRTYKRPYVDAFNFLEVL